eukprot:TRINITY_DN287_c0_g1_i4.p1 TRINITY_DN287_c0_g1~~TRINITY_DN287_c0_g1_i4.p1  ORF type:complete len:243 (-),score=28.35 TRINITY_DN287_c0_g1_i4:170-820(-)
MYFPDQYESEEEDEEESMAEYEREVKERSLERMAQRECGFCRAVSRNLKKCGSCKVIYYCGEDCQKKHWRTHKKDNGTLVFACGWFASFINGVQWSPFFQSFGQSWGRGDYNRSTCVPSATARSTYGLTVPYSMKANSLSGVAVCDVIHSHQSGARTQSMVPSMAGVPVSPGQVQTAITSLGQGKFAYSGDVNFEEETKRCIVQLCLTHSRATSGK